MKIAHEGKIKQQKLKEKQNFQLCAVSPTLVMMTAESTLSKRSVLKITVPSFFLLDIY